MIVLSNTTDKIMVNLTGAVTVNQLRCLVSWRDRTATTFIADRTVINTNNTTDVNISGSPSAGGTQRLIDYISIYNLDTTNKTVNIKFDANATQYNIITATLAPGETIDFAEGRGWIVYTINGSIRSLQSAAGNTTEIQFNNDGVISGSPNFTYNSINNDLSLLGTNAVFSLQNITNEPSVPPVGVLDLYAKSVCGKVMLKQMGPSGLDTPLQNAIWQNNTVLWTPAAAAGIWQGTVGTNLGTPTIALPTLTNAATMLRRSLFPTVVTTLNQQVGTRTEAMFFRGNAAGLGGFFMVTRFMLSNWTTGNRLFIGFAVGTTAVVTVEPSILLNTAGFCVESADSAISFLHNDAAGVGMKETISGQPSLATNNGYVAYIFARPNDNTIYYRLDNLNTGTTIVDSFTTIDLPVANTGLICHAAIGNAANISVNSANIGLNRIYVETDF